MENAVLIGSYNESTGVLTVIRSNGQTYTTKDRAILAGGHRVFGVETVGNEIHVLTAPSTNQRPSRRVKFNDAAICKGSSGF